MKETKENVVKKLRLKTTTCVCIMYLHTIYTCTLCSSISWSRSRVCWIWELLFFSFVWSSTAFIVWGLLLVGRRRRQNVKCSIGVIHINIKFKCCCLFFFLARQSRTRSLCLQSYCFMFATRTMEWIWATIANIIAVDHETIHIFIDSFVVEYFFVFIAQYFYFLQSIWVIFTFNRSKATEWQNKSLAFLLRIES